jgi:competence protein ComEC
MGVNNYWNKKSNNVLVRAFPIAVLLVLSFIRVYYNCLRIEVAQSCLEPRDSAFVDRTRFPGNYIGEFRDTSAKLVRSYIPSPHSELLIGTVMGADELSKVPKFKEALKISGTIHVVVVSGFNISLIFGFVTNILGSKHKLRSLILAQSTTAVYSMLTGFQPPVIRALVMGSLVSWIKYSDMKIDTFKALLITALVMIILWPYFLFSVSFQLSFLATLGLVVFGNYTAAFFKKLFKKESFIVEDLSTTISAQVFVLPLVSYYFGRISIISFLVNPLVLWTIPICTILGFIFLVFGSISSMLAVVCATFIYPFLDIFVRLITFFATFNFSSTNFSASIKTLVIYYLFTLLAWYLLKRRKGKMYENK